MNNPEIPMSINEVGELLEPDLHDAKLLMIKNHADDLIVTFELYSKEIVQAFFKGVAEFVCNAFGRQNIVLDMTIDTKRLVSARDLEKIYRRPPAMLAKHDALISRLQEKIFQGKYCYVEINPSCGCEVYILCQSVKFKKPSGLQKRKDD